MSIEFEIARFRPDLHVGDDGVERAVMRTDNEAGAYVLHADHQLIVEDFNGMLREALSSAQFTRLRHAIGEVETLKKALAQLTAEVDILNARLAALQHG